MSKETDIQTNAPPTVEQPETSDSSYLRRLEKSVALLSKIASVSVFSVVGSFCVVLSLLPLKKTETVFVSLKDGQQMVRLLPQEIDRTTKEEYIRSVLFEYIEKRETINFVDESERFAWLQAFTHPQWFRLFADHMNSSELTREIAIQTLEKIPDTDHIWRAEYIATDRKSGQRVRSKSFVATFKAYTTPILTDQTKTGLNPFGLIVENYAVSVKGRPNDKDNSL